MKTFRKTLCLMMACLLCSPFVQPVKAEEEQDTSLSNEERMAGFIERAFYGEELSAMEPLPADASIQVKKAGDSLSGFTAAVYKELVPLIKETAAGKRASTTYTLSYKSLLGRNSWTFEELGVSDYGAAFAKITEMTRIELHTLLTALLADLPYDLYWYDKTRGTSIMPGGMSGSSSGGVYTVEVNDGYTISFSVANEYAISQYETDTSFADKVQKAAANAKAIVSKLKNSSDFEKLEGYKKEICSLVSYNDEAAYSFMDYGNPWQLVWVFDGDTSTNVVCEGYSKAFQYLCEQTAFDLDISVNSVSGTMNGGGHMWNIVSFPGNQNYLADVTNSDGTSVGSDGGLFLASPASGSYNTSYTFKTPYYDVIYKYDSDMSAVFKAEDLILSTEAFDPTRLVTIRAEIPAEICVGDYINVDVQFIPADTVYKELVCTSLTPSRIEIDENGVLHGLKTGNATVQISSPRGNTITAKLRVLFTDVPSSGVYYSKPVYWAVDKAITAGFKDEDGLSRCFGPERNCTRAQMVTFLWRLAGKPEPKTKISEFSDLTDTSLYYYKAVLWAAEKGITAGYSDGTFRPDETCLREHAVTFLWRYAGKPVPKSVRNPFNDINISDYYFRASVWANENGIAKGYSEGEYAGGFGPKLDCLREHIVTFMYRYAN